jgi:hypothetical protein
MYVRTCLCVCVCMCVCMYVCMLYCSISAWSPFTYLPWKTEEYVCVCLYVCYMFLVVPVVSMETRRMCMCVYYTVVQGC